MPIVTAKTLFSIHKGIYASVFCIAELFFFVFVCSTPRISWSIFLNDAALGLDGLAV
jgi:hypothetical protein